MCAVCIHSHTATQPHSHADTAVLWNFTKMPCLRGCVAVWLCREVSQNASSQCHKRYHLSITNMMNTLTRCYLPYLKDESLKCHERRHLICHEIRRPTRMHMCACILELHRLNFTNSITMIIMIELVTFRLCGSWKPNKLNLLTCVMGWLWLVGSIII